MHNMTFPFRSLFISTGSQPVARACYAQCACCVKCTYCVQCTCIVHFACCSYIGFLLFLLCLPSSYVDRSPNSTLTGQCPCASGENTGLGDRVSAKPDAAALALTHAHPTMSYISLVVCIAVHNSFMMIFSHYDSIRIYIFKVIRQVPVENAEECTYTHTHTHTHTHTIRLLSWDASGLL